LEFLVGVEKLGGIEMKMRTESDVLVFHDETNRAGEKKLSGHILLFVPEKLRLFYSSSLFGEEEVELNPLKMLFSKIEELRRKFSAFHKFHFSEISGNKWTKIDEAGKQLVIFGVDALRSKGSNIFEKPLRCKIAVIFFPTPTSDILALYGGECRKEKIVRFNETILRMLLKGAVHYLYDEDNKVKILKIITDGKPYHRKLSEDRIVWRLIEQSLSGNLKKYVEIPLDAEILHLASDHRKYSKDTENYVYANMLQLADMLLGSVIQSCLKGIKWQKFSPDIDKKSIIAYPVKEMIDKRKRGKNFVHSGHYKSFAISEACIANGEWQFEDIMTKEIVINDDLNGMTLFDLEGMK